jgi:hypothetical protein
MWRLLNLFFAALFLFGAVVQLNDPDPVRWVAIYMAAAAPCVLAALDRRPRLLPALVLVMAVVWAATLGPAVIGRVDFFRMFDAWEMSGSGVEESREMYGLAIVAAWMAVLVVLGFRRVRSH